jgi:hypothetical protein
MSFNGNPSAAGREHRSCSYEREREREREREKREKVLKKLLVM